MMRQSPIVYAHRGASLELPENTLPSFARALELGADALETDAHMTRDGHVVLSHDETGQRMAGIDTPIRHVTLEQLREWDVGWGFRDAAGARPFEGKGYRVPTLAEALEACPDVVFNVDAKQTDPDMVPALLRVIRRAGASHRVRIASFSTANLRRVRALGYEGETGLGPLEVARLALSPSWTRPRAAGHAAQVPPRGWGITFASQAVIDRFHAAGVRVDFWTVDDPAEATRLFALGADGVMTDDPARVVPVLRPA